MIKGTFLTLMIIMAVSICYGEDIVLKNGSIIKGTIIKTNGDNIVVRDNIIGNITIKLSDILSIKKKKDRTKGMLTWNNEFKSGFTQTGGNIKQTKIYAAIKINRNKLWIDEWTFKASYRQDIDNDNIINRDISSYLRYGFSLTKAFYGFGRIAIKHSYSAGIDIRIVPTGGFGYWFFDKQNIKLMFEIGGGYRKTSFSSGTKEESPILQFRLMYRQKLKAYSISIDNYLFPSTSDIYNYIFQNSISMKFFVSNSLFIEALYKYEYNTNPDSGKKHYDNLLSINMGVKF